MTDLSHATTALPALLRDRVALVTGAANGLGATIAATLAAAGARGVALDREPVAEPPADWLGLAADVTDPGRAARRRRDDGRALGPPRRRRRQRRRRAAVARDRRDRRGRVGPPSARSTCAASPTRSRPRRPRSRSRRARRCRARPPLRAAAPRSSRSPRSTRARPIRGRRSTARPSTPSSGSCGRPRSTSAPTGSASTPSRPARSRPTRCSAGWRDARPTAACPQDDALAAAAQETALGRIATAAEVAQTVLFLASDLASGITGQVIPVDAGIA